MIDDNNELMGPLFFPFILYLLSNTLSISHLLTSYFPHSVCTHLGLAYAYIIHLCGEMIKISICGSVNISLNLAVLDKAQTIQFLFPKAGQQVG